MQLKNIYCYRVEKNIKQKEIIEYLKVTKGTYSAWESGQDIIPLKRLNDLCNYLNISIDYALGITTKIKYPNSSKNIDINIISSRLKTIRKENKYTLKKLAEKLNTSQSVLSRYENGKTVILLPYLMMYYKEFKISTDYLLGKIDSPKYLK